MNRKRNLFVLLKMICCLFVLSGAVSSVRAQTNPKEVVKVQAMLASQSDKTAAVEIKLAIAPKYHINANPASEDYLIPVEVSMAPAKGVTFGKPVYPAGEKKKFAFTTKPIAVYESTVSIRVPVTKIARSATNISGSVRYQACNDQACLFPTTAKFTVSLNASQQSATPSTNDQSATPQSEPVSPQSMQAFAQTLQKQYKVVGLPQIVFLDGSGKERTDLRAGEELTRNTMLQKLDALHSGKAREVSTHEEAGASSWTERIKAAPLLLQLALVFVGGLLLNLTPCVYPMIPITIGYFGGQSEGRIGRTVWLAALYVLGLALVYSILGVSAALTGSLFGSLLQSRFVVGAVAVVLFVLALSMFGLFTIQPPRFFLQRSGAKKGALGALAMGALLGIVAAPCVGPVVAALLLYVGEKRSPQLGFVLFFALSMGLGLPYLLLGAFSGALKSLPKSGLWLERSKKIFAVPLALAALYYGYSALKPASATTPAAPGSAAKLTVATSKDAVSQSGHERWGHATAAVIEEARRSGRPVVLDFRADWCLPCLEFERDIFSKPDVLRAAKNAVLLKVDLTHSG